ncbi:GAF domain-containing protein [Streptomyces lasalocidi]
MPWLGIGSTLVESTTCAELTEAAVRLAGGTAAVLRRTGKTISGYEEINGDADVLPDVRWATAVAREAGAPALDTTAEPWLEYAGAPSTRAALCLTLTSGDDVYGVLVWARSGEPLRPLEAELLSVLAERAASHIRHARAYEHVNRTAARPATRPAGRARPPAPQPRRRHPLPPGQAGTRSSAATGARPCGCTSGGPCWSSATSWDTAWRPPST